jgi:hypothetical protein
VLDNVTEHDRIEVAIWIRKHLSVQVDSCEVNIIWQEHVLLKINPVKLRKGPNVMKLLGVGA